MTLHLSDTAQVTQQSNANGQVEARTDSLKSTLHASHDVSSKEGRKASLSREMT